SQKRPLAVHRPSACSGVKALRNTSDAKRQSRQATLAFRSLDPFRALRKPDRRRRMKNGLSRSEQRTVSKTQKQPLDRKNPIQVICEPDFLDQGADRHPDNQIIGRAKKITWNRPSVRAGLGRAETPPHRGPPLPRPG